MSLQFVILVVGNSNELEQQLPHVKNTVEFIGGEANEIVFTECDKDKIKKELIRFSDDDNDVIIILGDTTLHTTSKIAHDAIKEVMDKKISKVLNNLMSDLGEKLKYSFDFAICGVRDQTLMINMSSCCLTAMIFLKAIEEIILRITNAIAEDEEISNNSNVSDSENAFSPHCLSDEEKKRISTTIEMYKKGQQNDIMNSVQDAINQIGTVLRNSVQDIHKETVNTKDAYGRLLADYIFSPIDVPSYRTSAKHGYAVLASDGEGVRRVLAAHVTSAQTSVVPGTCMRVRSGARIPDGATAIVTLDHVQLIGSDANDNANHNDYFNSDDKEYEIYVLIDPAKNDNIRNKACEIENGQLVLEKYSRIGPAALGVLTLCGIRTVSVLQVSSVGLLSIGDELEDPENPLGSDRIYDSNRITLTSLLKENGFDSVDFGISAYQLNAIIQKMQNALENVDVLVTMGRANDNDMLKPILKEYFNATIHFGRVNMKPGKSTTFATCTVNNKKKYLLCMSANPATVPIVAHVLLLPFLNELNCNYLEEPIVLQARLYSKQELHLRPKFAWATLQWNAKETFPRVFSSKNKKKTEILKYSRANGLLMLPPRTLQLPVLPEAFVQATFFVSQSPAIDE